eukprot:jgi/Galph1/51/GphlegSOOS_G4873.1
MFSIRNQLWRSSCTYTHLLWRKGLYRYRQQPCRPRYGKTVIVSELQEVVNYEKESEQSGDLERLRLSFGEQARTVVHVCKTGTLCTNSVKHNDTPFGSHVDYILDDLGRPIVLLAQNAAHMRNLRSSASCSLFCQPLASSGQSGCRVTLVGYMVKLPVDQIALKYPEFAFYRMEILDIYFVGGYGVTATWVEPNEYISAEPDPLAFQSQELLTCVQQCEMAMIDRLGFDMRVQLSETDIKEYRIGFREHVVTTLDAQSSLVQAMQEAWELENGHEYLWQEEQHRPIYLYYSLDQKNSRTQIGK